MNIRNSLLTCGFMLCSGVAHAHHGGVSMGAASLEGPGAALETTSAYGLGERSLVLLLKNEYVPFQSYGFAAPENKDYSNFSNLAVGYGITPWLSVYALQPFSIKAQDTLGSTEGFGDTNLMVSLGFKYDEGFRLIPERESLDDLMDWHFSFALGTTLPVGKTERKDKSGEYFAPDMQSGFGLPSPTLSLAVAKQFLTDLTWLSEVNFQYFFSHEYSYTKYQFGAETRFNNALVYRLFARGAFRLDLMAELGLLNLQRDWERGDDGKMADMKASGGTILYAGGGLRSNLGRLSLALGIKKGALSSLNEGSDQQGSEGLERFRMSATMSYAFGL